MYTYQEALEASVEYFEGDELAGKTFVDKYALRNKDNELMEKTPADMHKRLAKEFARIEKKKFKNPMSENEIFDLLDKFKYIIPQGGPMSGIGDTERFVSLSNCVVADSPEDSYGGILHTDQQLVQLSKRRCGVGIDITNIRPRDTIVTNSSRTSTGIVPFMERYSNSIREVGQGGRRGALMITCDVLHPQIEDFITSKMDDVSVTGANISVKLRDVFLRAVKAKEKYTKQWPVGSESPQIVQEANARDLWKQIIHCAWSRAEPGLLFWDTILRECPANVYSRYSPISTNPCQPANAWVLTKNGLTTFGDIVIGDEIWSESGWTKVVNKWSTGQKQTYKYKTTAGIFYGTENHKIVENGQKVEVKNATQLDIILGPELQKIDLSKHLQTIVDGMVIGDGSYKDGVYPLLYIGQDDNDYFTSDIKPYIEYQFDGDAYKIKTTIKPEELPYTYERFVPKRFITGSDGEKLAFLRGLYSANGSVCDNRITLKAASKQIIEDVQLMLSSVGIRSYYTTNRPKIVKFSNGNYQCKESYDLNISIDRHKFVNLIGFIQHYKNNKIKIVKSYKPVKSTFDINYIEDCGIQEVFDITVDNPSHTYWTGCVNVSNCSEIPLPALDSCRLLVLNLLSYVDNPFTKQAVFNYELFKKHAKIAQRLMDNIVDLEAEAILRIIGKIKSDPESDDIKREELTMWQRMYDICVEGRRTGTGVTAVGDTLAALGIKYGSTKSIDTVDEIYKQLKLSCYASSVDMAKELGPFKGYYAKLEAENSFIIRLKEESPELYKDMVKYGRRNVALLTTAPTGTVSIMTRTTSGIEPLFLMSYTRRKKGNPGDKDFRADFIDKLGDAWQEFKVYHPTLTQWMKITGKTNEEESPWYGCCAADLNWKNRVKLQAAAQRHIDHAISSTINLPNDVTEEQVAEIYEFAWETGIIKGITVYRDGCRTGVLISNKEEKKSKLSKTNAPPRPKTLPCDVHHLTVKGIRYFAIIGLMENEPYEVFIGRNCNSEGDSLISKGITTGLLEKVKRGHYTLVDGDGKLIHEIISANCEEHEEMLARMTSTALRHGSDISFVVHQLEKTRGDMQSFSKVIARTLKKYIPDGTEVKGETCQNCGGKLVRIEGCQSCQSCGWSKC